MRLLKFMSMLSTARSLLSIQLQQSYVGTIPSKVVIVSELVVSTMSDNQVRRIACPPITWVLTEIPVDSCDLRHRWIRLPNARWSVEVVCRGGVSSRRCRVTVANRCVDKVWFSITVYSATVTSCNIWSEIYSLSLAKCMG